MICVERDKNYLSLLPLDIIKLISIYLKPSKELIHITNEIDNDLNRAKEYALKGNYQLMTYALNRIRENCNKYNINNKDIRMKINEIQVLLTNENELIYINSEIDQILNEARQYALKGNRQLMTFKLNEVKEKSNKYNIDINDRINEIQNLINDKNELLYINNIIDEKLNDAKQYALKGNRRLMIYILNEVKKTSNQYNIDIKEKINEIQNLINDEMERKYINDEITEKLNDARRYALKGNRQLMTYLLDDVIKKSNQHNIDIKEKVDEIQNILKNDIF
jgi:hypothetical protein